jgi:transposase
MNIMELSTLIQDEKNCEEYLRQVGILKSFTNCVRCGSDKLGIIRRNRYKCYKCKTEWSIYRDSFLVTVNVEVSKFIMAIKLYELELNITAAAQELNITRKTATKIYSYFRKCIIGEVPNFINNRIIKDNAPLFRIV